MMSIATELKRINPEEVMQAYTELGIKPIQGCYHNSDYNCACGVGVMAIKLRHQDLLSKKRKVQGIALSNYFGYLTVHGYDCNYLSGFIHGFDDVDTDKNDTDNFKLGVEDGKATWQKVNYVALQ